MRAKISWNFKKGIYNPSKLRAENGMKFRRSDFAKLYFDEFPSSKYILRGKNCSGEERVVPLRKYTIVFTPLVSNDYTHHKKGRSFPTKPSRMNKEKLVAKICNLYLLFFQSEVPMARKALFLWLQFRKIK